ncbi:hypothetical protein [Roseomonas genomospecies 6]|uniref:Uncharacterized protein n=1 Tax=Roseomonas genomospecies 6 TaxID=214106 RepID=A0A9W7NLH6_9PROT|nr:hypothetical protein [Roseomonas genomospecies 6]KAA0682208.1 hypothetical protein DS843_06590 [Roseomonas genomospecies 6]
MPHDPWAQWARYPRWVERQILAAYVVIDEHGKRIVGPRGTRDERGRVREPRCPPGRFVGFVYDPPVPSLPRGLEGSLWAQDYDAATPFASLFWRGFFGDPVPDDATPDQRGECEAGRRAATSREGEAYRRYVGSCRTALRDAGWATDEIP